MNVGDAERQKVLGSILRVLARALGLPAEAITTASRADDLPGWDSLTHLIVVTGVERAFDIALPKDAAYATQDVGGLADLVLAALHRRADHVRV